MARKIFNRVWGLALMAAFLTFAALGGGGCGGSSHSGGSGGSSNGEGQEQQGRDLSGSDLAAYLVGDEYQSLVNEYIREASADAATRAAIDKVEFFREAYEGEEETPNEELVEALDAGKVLALVYPDAKLINDFLDALGVEDNYARPAEDATDYLELFAVAQRTVNDSPQIFTYSVADLDNFTVVSDDLTSADFPPEGYVAQEGDTLAPATTKETFEKSRVTDFLAWVAGLDKAAEDWATDDEVEAASVRVTAATEDLSRLASAHNAPTKSYNFTQEDLKRIGSTSWKFNRESALDYKVWSLHSFDNHYDYFVIELNAVTDPSKQYNSWMRNTGYDDIHQRQVGLYTRQLVYEHTLAGAGNYVSTEKFAPTNPNNTRSETKGISEKFGAKVGINKTPGIDFSYEITYNSSRTFTYKDYTTRADVSGGQAKWTWDFDLPKDSNDGTVYVVSDAVSKKFNAQMEWVWKVAPGYWTNNKAALMNINYTWVEGTSTGDSKSSGVFRRVNSTPATIKKQDTLELPRPPHLATRPVSFAPTAGNKGFDKSAGNATLYVLSESDWTIKADANWISGFTPEKGSATGKTEVAVTFSYGTNDTGKPRTTNITLTNTEGDKVTIQVNQGGN